MMRTLFTVALLLTLGPGASACDCFSAEHRARAAQDALERARLAVYGRVVEVGAAGSARLLVLQSFKGPAKGSSIVIAAGAGACAAPALALGEEALVLSFGATATACDTHPPEHFLVDALRAVTANEVAARP